MSEKVSSKTLKELDCQECNHYPVCRNRNFPPVPMCPYYEPEESNFKKGLVAALQKLQQKAEKAWRTNDKYLAYELIPDSKTNSLSSRFWRLLGFDEGLQKVLVLLVVKEQKKEKNENVAQSIIKSLQKAGLAEKEISDIMEMLAKL